MKGLLALAFAAALAAALAAAWPAHAQRQRQGQPQGRPQEQGMQPQKMSDGRRDFSHGRPERRERFSREERDKLRQDLLDANRDMKGRR